MVVWASGVDAGEEPLRYIAGEWETNAIVHDDADFHDNETSLDCGERWRM